MAYDEQLAERVRAVVDGEPGLSEKAMFGGLAFLVDGNMAVAASSQGGLLLRVDPAKTQEYLDDPNVARFRMRGRDMDGWLRIDPLALADETALRRWIGVGISFARSLPAK